MAKSNKIEKKRKRNRKARTEVSTSPSASSSSAAESLVNNESDEIHARSSLDNDEHAKEELLARSTASGDDDAATVHIPALDSSSSSDLTAAFIDFYLKQSTREFADDLEKLRAAKDFRGEVSVGLLVRALRQGSECFSAGERMKVGAAAAAGGSTRGA